MVQLDLDRDIRYGLAFSGGVDSSLLLALMVESGLDVVAYTVSTAFQPQFENDDARGVAALLGARHEVVDVDVLAHADVCANPTDRCYLCKRIIFGTILDHMGRDGRAVLVDGTNATDDPARRPGFRALAELGVRSPLREAGLAKDAIRELSRARGLPTAEKPSFSCYATHVPAGEPITERSLATAAVSADAEAATWSSRRAALFGREARRWTSGR